MLMVFFPLPWAATGGPRRLPLLGLALCCAGLCGGQGGEAEGRTAELLLSALRHATGLSDEELRHAAEDLLGLPRPPRLQLWREHVRCGPGTCAGEAAARVVAALGEARKLPLRGFEPFPGDPLFELWKREDRQEFHSWSDGRAADNAERLVPEGQPLAIGRLQAAEFVRQAKETLVSLVGSHGGAAGRCIEWDTPFYTVKGLGGLCSRHDVLVYADVKAERYEKMEEYAQGTRVLWLDIQALPEWAPRDYGLVVCLFVLEHVPEPQRAVDNIARMLKTGGLALLGAPFLDGVHGCPDDYYRYTPNGLRHLAEAAGLEVLWTYAPGAPAVAAGEMVGMKSSYWSADGVLQQDTSGSHPTNVFLVARRPWTGRRGSPKRPGKPPRRNLTAWMAAAAAAASADAQSGR